MLYLLPAVTSKDTFNEDHSWCAENAKYLQQPTNMRQDYGHYSMGGRIFSVCCFHLNVRIILPRTLYTVSKCAGNYDTRRCSYHSTEMSCVIFCHGQRENVCCQIIQCKLAHIQNNLMHILKANFTDA